MEHAETPASGGNGFVGRDTELATLRGEIEAAFAGRGRVVLLVGEPGIGKSRTAAVLSDDAAARGAAVVWGRCREGEGAPVYWPWVQALGAYANEHTGPAAGEVAALLPRLVGTAGHAARTPEQARFELFRRIAVALLATAREQPLLIVLDDLHWADAGSLVLLEFLAPELNPARVCVLGTLREVELRRRPEVAPIARLARQVPLRGLEWAAVRDLLAGCLGHAPDDGVVDDALAVTEGNPFLVLELAHLLAANAAPRGRAPITPAAHDLVRRRLGPLPAPTLHLLEAAAVMGREFDLGPLTSVLAMPTSALLDALGPALAAGVAREVPGRLRRYSFAHALVREALYDDLTPGTRARLHAAVGEALEGAGAEHDDRLAMLAHHFFEAAQGGDPAKAIRFERQAGDRALESLAFEEAARHYERVLEALAVAPEDDVRLHVLAGLGEARHGAGDHAGADALFRDAVVVARRLGWPAFAETVLRFANLRWEFGVLDVEMNELLDEALARLPPAPSSLRARLLARLSAGLLLQPGAEARRKVLGDEAAAMARAQDDPATLAFVLGRRVVALLDPDTLEERRAATDEILRLSGGSRAAELEALILRIGDLAEGGDRVGLDHALVVFEQKARALRHPFFLWTAASFRVAMALLEGRFAEVEALAGEALGLGQRAQARTAALHFGQQLFALRRWQARLAEVEPLVMSGVAETAVVPSWRIGLAGLLSVTGRTAEAAREFEAVAADGFAGVPRDVTWLTSMCLLARICARLGDVRRAEQLYELMRPYGGRIAVVPPLVVLVGTVDDGLGVLATVLERWDAAEQHFAAALGVATRMRGLPCQADIRHAWGAMLLARGAEGERARAHALLDEAEAIARQLGMALLLEWIVATRTSAAVEHVAARVEAVGGGSPRATVLTLVPRPAQRSGSESPGDAAPRAGILRLDGDVWTLVFEGRTTRVRHMLGLVHLARLLAEPGHEVHVAELVTAAYGSRREPEAAGEPRGDAGEQLDARARADYETRLRDVRDELEEATRMNDLGRSERLRREIEILAGELSRGFGLGGRPRRAAAVAERARLAVTRAIRYALERVAEHDPALAEHLHRAVRTGTFCVYAPPSRDQVAWTLQP